MKTYEITYLFSPDLSEINAQGLENKITKIIQDKKGAVIKSGKTKKIKLSYPIKKERRSWLQSIEFSALPEKTAGIKEELDGQKEIMRYLIICKKPSQKASLAKERPSRKRPKPETVEKPALKERVEIKDLDEKLEEILGK